MIMSRRRKKGRKVMMTATATIPATQTTLLLKVVAALTMVLVRRWGTCGSCHTPTVFVSVGWETDNDLGGGEVGGGGS